MHETGLFSPAVYLCFQRHPNKLVRKVTPVFAIIFAFAFRKKRSTGPIPTIHRNHALRISVLGAERIYSFLSVFLSRLSTVV